MKKPYPTLALAMLTAFAVNAQTLTNYTYTPSNLGIEVPYTTTIANKNQINFNKPVNIASIISDAGATMTYFLAKTLSNNAIVTTTLSGTTFAATNNVIQLIVSANANTTLTITGTISTVFDTTKANTNGYNAGVKSVDTTKIYNHGVTAGKATCLNKSEILKSDQISVYPNPASNMVSVDVNGNSTTIGVADLAKGYYLLKIIDLTGKVVKTEKLIISQ